MSSIQRRGKVVWYFARHNGVRIQKSLQTEDWSEAKRQQILLDFQLLKKKPKDGYYFEVAKEAYLRDVALRSSNTHYPQSSRQFLERFAKEQQIGLLEDITSESIVRHLTDRKLAGNSKSTLNNFTACIKAFTHWAFLEQLIDIDPAARVKKIMIETNQRTSIPLDKAKMVLELIKDEYQYPFFALVLFTGMRMSEVKRLDWKYIDLEARQITVLGSKASKAPKYFPISNALRDILIPYKRKDGPIVAKDGDTMKNLRRVKNRVFKKAGIPGLSWHHLRHTFATETLKALSGGNKLATVSKLLGHSDIKVTMKYITTIQPELLDASNAFARAITS